MSCTFLQPTMKHWKLYLLLWICLYLSIYSRTSFFSWNISLSAFIFIQNRPRRPGSRNFIRQSFLGTVHAKYYTAFRKVFVMNCICSKFYFIRMLYSYVSQGQITIRNKQLYRYDRARISWLYDGPAVRCGHAWTDKFPVWLSKGKLDYL
jgi:hypothetical protein